mgnify:FL=1
MAPVSVGSSAPFHARRPSSHAHHHRRFSSSLSENGLLSGLTSAADSDVEESRIPTPEPLQSSGKPSNSEVTRQRSVTEAVVMDSLKSSRSAGSSASLLDMMTPEGVQKIVDALQEDRLMHSASEDSEELSSMSEFTSPSANVSPRPP